MKQETREWALSALLYGMWGLAVLLTYMRINGSLGQEWGATIILCMGVAIAAAVRLSRMKLTATMLEVYRAGIETARVQHEERAEMEKRIKEASSAGRPAYEEE